MSQATRVIGDESFDGCSNLTNVSLNADLYNIGNKAFRNCSSLTKINIPDYVSQIGSFAFSGCSNLPSIDLSKLLKVIEKGTFMDCTALTNVTINGNLTCIEDSAFKNNRSLKEIVLPKTTTSIGSHVFIDCPNLLQVYSKPYEPPVVADDKYFFSNESYYNALLHTPNEGASPEYYSIAKGWQHFFSAGMVSLDDFSSQNENTIVEPGSISLLSTSLSMEEGETHVLQSKVFPEDAIYTLTWNSSNNEYATVDQNGIITALKSNHKKELWGWDNNYRDVVIPVTITVTTNNGKTATCKECI